MTEPEGERLARLETRTDHQQRQLDRIESKVNQLLDAANMGKGAWWMLLKIGGVLSVIVGFAWMLYERIHPKP